MAVFDNLSDKLQSIFKDLRRHGKLSEADIDAAMREIRLALLEADVHYGVVKSLIVRVKERALGAEVAKSLSPAQQVLKIVHEEMIRTLGPGEGLKLRGNSPYVIMLAGLQGSGKTTTAAKLALHLRKQGYKPMMAAADIYRPAAIEQLKALGRQLDVPVYSEEGAQPPQIASNALRAAFREGCNVLLVDTAGRLQIDEALMQELVDIRQQVNPTEILLVADSMLGQEAVNVAQGFNERIPLTGLILTKTDGDARGGAAISMREVTGVPIKFLGTSEKSDGLEVFHPDRLAGRILNKGDILSLIERAEALDIDEAEALEMHERLQKNDFNLEDMLKQMKMARKMGPISQLLEMIPGASEITRQVSPQDMEKQMNRVEAIINSMTLKERRYPKVLNASRRKRIAAGSGTSVQEVNDLIKRYQYTQKMMKKVAGGKNIPDIRKLFR